MAKGTITGDDVLKGVVERIQEAHAEFNKFTKDYYEFSKSLNNIKNGSGATSAITQNIELDEKKVKLLTQITRLEKEKANVLAANARAEASLARTAATQSSTEATQATAKAKLIRATTAQTRALVAQQRAETAKLNAEKKALQQTNRYADAYGRLTKELAESKRNLKNLTVEFGSNSVQTKKAAAEFEKLNTKVRAVDAAAGDFQRNVGNYPKALSGAVGFVKQLVGAFGAVEAIRLGARLIKDSIELAREAKGVEFAFERLGQVGVNAFENVRTSTRGLLSELDIKKALVDFDNFNISLEETDTLFEFLSVRAAQTGKSMDYLRDSLVEGLSKESKLRIDNLGISAEELNKELEKTPNFVQAVANIAKREVDEAGDILDQAANSGTKFNASLENISLSFGKILSTVRGFGFINDFLESYDERLGLLSKGLAANFDLMEKGRFFYRNFFEAGRKENVRLLEEIELRNENAKAIKRETEEFVKRNGSLAPLASGANGQNPFSLYYQPEEQTRQLRDINAELEKYNTQLSEGVFSTREEAKVIQDKIAALEKEKEAILGTQKAKKDLVNVIEGTIAWYEKEIAKENDFQKNNAKTREEIQDSIERIRDYQKSIDNLVGTFEKLEKIDIAKSLGSTDAISKEFEKLVEPFGDSYFDILKVTSENALKELERDVELYKSTEERKTQISKEEAEKRGEIFKTLFGSFANIYGLDLTLFEKMISKEKATMEDYANFGISTVGAFYDGKFANYEEDAARNKATLDAILNDSQASDKKKEQAQIEYDKKERKLQQQKAKAAKDEALFQIAISTAVAVVKSLPNYAQAIAVAALGGIQAGIVASRKIPQFFKGTDYAPRGWAWTDEKGAEIHTDRRGKIKDFGSNDGPRLKFLESGDKIFTAEKSKQLFNTEIFNSTDNIKHLMAQRLASDTNQRAAMFAVNSGVDSKEIGRAVERAISKYADRPLKIYNNVTYSKPRTRY